MNSPEPAIPIAMFEDTNHGPGASWVGWLPLAALPLNPVGLASRLEPWKLMWSLCFAIFFGCKWLTWWPCRNVASSAWRNLAYLFAWPGLDASAFLNQRILVPRPSLISWISPGLKTLCGAVFLWGLARLVPGSQMLLQGWIGMFGLILLLHFGIFHLLALGWQSVGIDALPLMRAPILSSSLADFWGHRWNSAFNALAHNLIFRPLHRRVGASAATLAVFLFSGLIHDLVISVPARAGFGLPTLYFLGQGIAILFERSVLGRKLGLRRGITGRCFALLVTSVPAFILFHPAFVARIIVPFMQTIHAL